MRLIQVLIFLFQNKIMQQLDFAQKSKIKAPENPQNRNSAENPLFKPQSQIDIGLFFVYSIKVYSGIGSVLPLYLFEKNIFNVSEKEKNMDPDSMIPHLAILLVLILINAFFAMSEIAIVTFNDNKLKKMAEDGNKRAGTLVKMVEEPSKFLSTIQIGVTLSGFLASAAAADQFADPFAQLLLPFMPYAAAESIALVVITLLLSYVTLVLGELVPKRIAMHYPEKISLMVAPVIQLVFLISKPFVAVLSFSTNLILKLFHIDPNSQPEQVTEEEIRMMVDVGNEEGSIEKDEADMIDNIFEFDDITAQDVMTHRTDVAAIENTATVMEVIHLAIEEGYSRIPVYEEDIDNIVGIVYAKDMLQCITETAEQMSAQPITPFIRKALFVPESNRCADLFKTFKEKKMQIAIVVDEYGGTSGIVTMEDLLESIVGNMQDEYDHEEEEYQKLSDNIFTLDGSMSLPDVEELLGTEVDPDEDYDTISGFITDRLDRIPAKDEHPTVRIGNIEFKVLQTDERRIAKLRAEILPQPQEPIKE